MKFRNIIENSLNIVYVNESIYNINDNSIGELITYTMHVISQLHVWHLVTRSGQKHTALADMYEELQDELDGLAERFIAQGGTLEQSQYTINPIFDYEYALSFIDNYRSIITNTISEIKNNDDMLSILDGVVDLQEAIDSNLYKFKLD